MTHGPNHPSAALRIQAPFRPWASASQGGGMCSDSESAGGSSESRSMDSPTASPGEAVRDPFNLPGSSTAASLKFSLTFSRKRYHLNLPHTSFPRQKKKHTVGVFPQMKPSLALPRETLSKTTEKPQATVVTRHLAPSLQAAG